MSKEVLFNVGAEIAKGIDILASAVKSTLGPRGRNVAIDKKHMEPIITKDGATVAKSIELPNRLQNMGVKLVKGVATKTEKMAGDGTSSSTILTQSIVNNGLKQVAAGANPIFLKKGIDKATAFVVNKLKSLSFQASNVDLEKVAYISGNGDKEVSGAIIQAYKGVGKQGAVLVEESRRLETQVEIVNGLTFDKGFMSPYFINTTEHSVEFEDADIAIFDDRVTSFQYIQNFLDTRDNKKPLLLICKMIDDTVLNIITQNVLRNPFRWAVMEAPGFGKEQLEMLKDIAAFTGGRIGAVKEGLPIQEFVSGDCGKVEKVILYKDRSVFIGGAGKDVAKRISQIKSEVGQSEHTYENELREARIARLKGGVAKVFVGGKSEVEIKEKTHRMDDALYAVKSALAEGVIVGGGTGLVRAYKSMDDGFLEGLSGEELQGALIVREALKAPIMTIADNAGASGEVVFEKVLEMKGSKGYDAMQGEYKDLKKAGILDPYKVARVSLENAASIAGMVLTMNCAVIYGEGDVENMKSYM